MVDGSIFKWTSQKLSSFINYGTVEADPHFPSVHKTKESGRLCDRFKYTDGDEANKMQRTLQSRHLTMIAIGGTIGTGIFLSSGYVCRGQFPFLDGIEHGMLNQTIALTGLPMALGSYTVVGIFVYAVMFVLGEMAAMYPVPGAFSAFGTRFVSPAFGFALGWNYWYLTSMYISAELTAAVDILQYWAPRSRPWHWAMLTFFPIYTLQFIRVHWYAESECGFTIIKVLMIIVFIFVGFTYDVGGIKGHPGPGLSNLLDRPAANNGWPAFAKTLPYTFYAYAGTEIVAIAAGESVRPDIMVKAATKATFFRIVLFYILTILIIGLCINSKDPVLMSTSYGSQISPLTVIFQRAGIGAGVHVFNAVLLTSVLSAASSDFYSSSRMLLSLARSGQAPRILGWVNSRGIPVPALLVALAVFVLTSTTTVWGNGVVFWWLLNLTGNCALLVRGSIGIISLRFRLAHKAQERSLSDLPFVQPLFPTLPICILLFVTVLLSAQGYTAAKEKPFEFKSLIAAYIGAAPFVILYTGYTVYEGLKYKKWRLLVPLSEIDLDKDAVWKEGEGKENQRRNQAEAEEERRKIEAHGVVKRYWMYIIRYIY